MSLQNLQPIDETYELYERFTPQVPQFPQRQQRQQQPLNFASRPSSSSGSTRTLRRTPKFEEQERSGRRASSAQAAYQNAPLPLEQFLPALVNPGDSSSTPRVRRQSSPENSYWPRRSTRISKRTASAILYALEEAIRTPFPFTPDLIEENASMADSAGVGPIPVANNGRAQNGGSKTASEPVPVPQYPPTTRVTTPTDIMRQRREREARRRAESEAKQQEQEHEERRVAERTAAATAAAAGVGGNISGEASSSRRSGGASGTRRSVVDEPRVQEDSSRRRSARVANEEERRVTAPAGPAAPAAPAYRSAAATYPAYDPSSQLQPQTTRSRGASLQAQPRPVVPQASRAASATYSNQQQPSQTRQTSAGGQTNLAQAGPSVAPSTSRQAQTGQSSAPAQVRNPNTSSFPHAFERWETLSSHWEGLTSYWIRRLEQNSDETTRDPLNQQLARQVTDLSAAGANLFHAVVELQRLRASSERKFQRWFYETRTEQERSQERLAELEAALRTERQARAETNTNVTRDQDEKETAEQVKASAKQMVEEMKRELAISKGECRRAWDELGRREQEERDRTTSLRSGEPTLVGGVQVVPMIGTASRQPSTNRPPTREGPLRSEAGTAETAMRGVQSGGESPTQGDAGYTTYDPTRSDTDTDPFTEGGHEAPPQVPEVPPIPEAHTQQPAATASPSRQAALYSNPPQSSNGPSQAAPTSNGGGTYLSYGPSVSMTQPQTSSSFYQHQGTALQDADTTQPRTTEADQRSFVPSVEDTISEDEYELDERGEVRLDTQGHPLMYRRGAGSEDSDEYDVQEQLERERNHGQRYGTSGVSGVEYGSGPTPTVGTSGSAGGVYNVSAGSGRQGPPVDYSGSGYGSGWEAVPRHHHPTRLSDVLEEDERSRTSPSRASQRSGGYR